MILKDRPPYFDIHLPADNLSDAERLKRLFRDTGDRWRLLAVLNHSTGASRLLEPELDLLVSGYGPRGLMSRIVYNGGSDLLKVNNSLRRWARPNTRATSLDIHAARIVGDDPLPAIRLYGPGGVLRFELTGFDTEKGLDDLLSFLDSHFTGSQTRKENS